MKNVTVFYGHVIRIHYGIISVAFALHLSQILFVLFDAVDDFHFFSHLILAWPSWNHPLLAILPLCIALYHAPPCFSPEGGIQLEARMDRST